MKILHLLVIITLYIQLDGYWEVKRWPNSLYEWGVMLALLAYALVVAYRAFRALGNDTVEQGS